MYLKQEKISVFLQSEAAFKQLIVSHLLNGTFVTEDELVKGCKNEDRHCQRIVFERYAGKMMTVCLRYARHRLEAEDILQESLSVECSPGRC